MYPLSKAQLMVLKSFMKNQHQDYPQMPQNQIKKIGNFIENTKDKI